MAGRLVISTLGLQKLDTKVNETETISARFPNSYIPHWVPYGLVYTPRPLYAKWNKAVPLQAWTGPEGSKKLRFPDFMKTAQDGSKVVSLTHRPPLPQANTPGTHFC